jgi:NADH-quinone oxidoreductase subunit C
MDSTTLVARLQEVVPGAGLEGVPSIDPQTTIYVSRDRMHDVARALRDERDLAFDVLVEVTAADFWPREPRFEIVYILVSIANRLRLRMKVRLQGDDARVPTLTDLWPSADWLEREVWDLFGVAFDGHPDPRRLLMPEDWDGFPLRKDYPVQIDRRPMSSEPLQVSEDEFRESLMRDRLTRP